MRTARLISLPLLGLLLATGSTAQESSAAYDEQVEVNVVNVDVVVTDSSGRPVLGLGRDDFLVVEDGEPVELTNFLAISGTPETRPSEPGAGSVPAAPTTKPTEPTHVVLYFDNSTLVQAHRNRVLDEVQGFVDQLGGDTRFLVVTFNPGLHLVSSFTDDPAVVREALASVAEMPARGLLAARARTSTREAMSAIWQNWEASKGFGPGDGSGDKRGSGGVFSAQGMRGRYFDPCVEAWPEMINLVESYAQGEVDRVQTAQAGLLGLTRALVGVPGRKYVLYMSDGLELVPAMTEYELLGELCPERVRDLFGQYSRYDQTAGFEELTALANAHRVTFYSLDTTGLAGVSLGSAELEDRRFSPSARIDAIRRENLRGSLFAIADDTAGRAIFNANQPAEELAEMAQDLSNFYSLGFNPGHGWDGKVHKVKVTLKEGIGGGYELRYRTRYRALPEAERVAERTLTALVLGATDNPLGMSVHADTPTPMAGGRYKVPLAITLPLERLTLLPERGADRGEVRVVVAIAIHEENRNSLFERSIPVEIAEPPADGIHVVTIHLQMEPGTHVIGLGVEDRLGRTASYLQTEILVGSGETPPAEGP